MKTEKPSLLVVSGYLPVGGSTTYLLNLLPALRREGMGAEIISLTESPADVVRQFAREGIQVQNAGRTSDILEDRLAKAYQLARPLSPNIIVANLGPDAFEFLRYVPPELARWGMIHSDDPAVYKLASLYAPYLDAIGCVSERIAEHLRQWPALASKRALRLDYGIPVPAQTPGRTAGPTVPLRMIYVGRLSRVQKRAHLFPEVARELDRRRADYRWDIIGTGPEESFLRAELAPAIRAGRIRLLGELERNAVLAIYANYDVIVLTSEYEGLPLCLLEAMAHGVVPVVSDLPSGIRQLVNAENGCLVPPDDPKNYAIALAGLAARPDNLRDLSVAARRMVASKYSVAAMAARWTEALRDASRTGPVWSATAKALPPLGQTSRLRFHPVFRPLRRLLKRASST